MRRLRVSVVGLAVLAAATLVAASSARSPVRERLNLPLSVAGAPAARLDIFSPADQGRRRLPVLLWIHGGGYISGNPQQILALSSKLTEAGYMVASVGYTLAPGAHYPTQLRQASAALAYVRGHAAELGIDPSRVFVGGDSAGAQIASELAAVQSNPRLADAIGLQPVDASLRGVVLYCGMYDMRTVGADRLARLDTFLREYTGTADWRHARQLSTVDWITSKYPPTLISDATHDPFYPQALELAAAIQHAGGRVTLRVWRGLHHDFQFDTDVPQAQQSLRRTIQFLNAHSG